LRETGKGLFVFALFAFLFAFNRFSMKTHLSRKPRPLFDTRLVLLFFSRARISKLRAKCLPCFLSHCRSLIYAYARAEINLLQGCFLTTACTRPPFSLATSTMGDVYSPLALKSPAKYFISPWRNLGLRKSRPSACRAKLLLPHFLPYFYGRTSSFPTNCPTRLINTPSSNNS
jgi:hypothetical protein